MSPAPSFRPGSESVLKKHLMNIWVTLLEGLPTEGRVTALPLREVQYIFLNWEAGPCRAVGGSGLFWPGSLWISKRDSSSAALPTGI